MAGQRAKFRNSSSIGLDCAVFNVRNNTTLAPTVETEIQGMKKQDRFDTSVNFPLAWHSIFPEFGDCCKLGLPLMSSLLLEYSSEYLNEYSSTR